jgi:hypothetical protein
MSFLSVAPDAVTSAAGHLGAIGSSVSEANAAAAGPTTGMAAMAGDEVSAAVQSVFAAYAQGYQTVSAQASQLHSQLVGLMNGSAAAYLNTEIANAQQTLAGGVAQATPAVAMTGAAVTSTIDILNFGFLDISETFPPTGGAFLNLTLLGNTFTTRVPDQLAQFILQF